MGVPSGCVLFCVIFVYLAFAAFILQSFESPQQIDDTACCAEKEKQDQHPGSCPEGFVQEIPENETHCYRGRQHEPEGTQAHNFFCFDSPGAFAPLHSSGIIIGYAEGVKPFRMYVGLIR